VNIEEDVRVASSFAIAVPTEAVDVKTTPATATTRSQRVTRSDDRRRFMEGFLG